jgi:hypothetical protein
VPKSISAEEIIKKSIEVSGGDIFGKSEIFFGFRDKTYMARRRSGEFLLVRMFKENDDSVTDFLSGSGFKRMVGEEFVNVSDSMVKKYTASVNSVHYFSILPYGLNDKAVNKIVLGEENIKGQNHYKIKVTFNQDGGGEDYEDVFVYWVNKKSFKVNYLAYSYNEDDGVGMRFREAYNERYVTGLRFVDYNNYKAEDTTIQLYELGKAFENNQLKLLSKIELDNVKVVLIDN